MTEAGLVERLAGSANYASLPRETLTWAARVALARSPKDAEGYAKKLLHQAVGAYLDPAAAKRLGKVLESPVADDADLRRVCNEALALHASTRERTQSQGLYEAIAARVGPVARVQDLGCGVHPLAWPWMQLPPGCTYVGCELDGRVVDRLRPFVERHFAGVSLQLRDVVLNPPTEEADVTWMLKLVPLLEARESGASRALMKQVRTRFWVLSFSTHSLGGRAFGDVERHEELGRRLLAAVGATAERLDFEGERVLFGRYS